MEIIEFLGLDSLTPRATGGAVAATTTSMDPKAAGTESDSSTQNTNGVKPHKDPQNSETRAPPILEDPCSRRSDPHPPTRRHDAKRRVSCLSYQLLVCPPADLRRWVTDRKDLREAPNERVECQNAR